MPGVSAAALERSASGFTELYVVSTTLAAHAGKALASCRRLLDIYPEISELTLVTNAPGCDALSGNSLPARLRIVDENSLFSVAAWSGKFARVSHLSPGRDLWYYQQILKLEYLFRSAAKFAGRDDADRIGLMIWDADTLPLRRIPLLDARSRRSYSYYTENPKMQHPPFFAVNALLTGTPPDARQRFSNIVQFAALSAGETARFAEFLRLDCHDDGTAGPLADRIVAAILEAGLANASLFSEYELIGLFHRLRVGGPSRRARFIRVNKRIPSRAQERMMRAARIDHFTSEEWYGEYSRLGNFYLLALIAEQWWPAVGRLRQLVTGRRP